MSAFSVASLKANCRFSADVVIDQTFLVCSADLPFPQQTIVALHDWNFNDVQSEGELKGSLNSQEKEAEEESRSPAVEKSVILVKSEQLQELLARTSVLRDPDASEEARLNFVQEIYDCYLGYIDALYTRYATHKELSLKEISETVQTLCDFTSMSKRYILRIQPKAPPENKNYLVNHAMRSTVLAIVVGIHLRLPVSKLVELGVSCILHEIGMIHLPPQLYLINRKLTPSERKQLLIHPVIGYNILRNYTFPLAITLGVLEHHEKEDGSGYPRRVAGDKISIFAKIISVVCSYEAITSPRTYKDEENTHNAIVELLKNRGKQYDETVVRALLFSISLYPIGAYVYLSDGKVGIVTDVNPENPKNPFVQLLNAKNPDGTLKTIATDDTANKISRMLSPEESRGIKKFLARG